MQSDSSTPPRYHRTRPQPLICAVANCKRPAHSRGYCVTHYMRWRSHGTPLHDRYDLASPIIERFWNRVDKSGGPDACWPFGLFKPNKTYGNFAKGFPVKSAHVIAWALTNKRWPVKGEVVRHSCDNPPCCNPKHLAIGTQRDNIADAFAHGHGWAADRSSSAKLTWEQVHELRRHRAEFKTSWRALARMFGVSSNAAWAAGVGKTWK